MYIYIYIYIYIYVYIYIHIYIVARRGVSTNLNLYLSTNLVQQAHLCLEPHHHLARVGVVELVRLHSIHIFLYLSVCL